MKPEDSVEQDTEIQEQDSDRDGAMAAMVRAGKQARRRAKAHGIPIVVYKDDRIQWLDPDDEWFHEPIDDP